MSKVRTSEDVQEQLRHQLAEWQAAGAMSTPEEADNVVEVLARNSGLHPQRVKMLWLSVARQTRAVNAPTHAYVGLAKKIHGLDVEVVDLGQYSAEHSNSCMFLTCAVMLADKRLQGSADPLPGELGKLLEASGAFEQKLSIENLVTQHSRTRSGTLGQMADALRHAACEVILHDMDYYLPFYHPVGCGVPEEPTAEDFRSWVDKLRGDEEGDELVILALSRLCGIAVQPVHQSGYRVPLMDPTGAAEAGCVTHWGNDDRHWVWLRLKNPEPA